MRARLQTCGARYGGTFFERNVIFETDPPSLREQGKLLRLRSNFSNDAPVQPSPLHILTFKGPVSSSPSSAIKIREEQETRIEDRAALCALLQGLGFVAKAVYEKVREVWYCMDAEVALDTLPFGSYAEIEGQEKVIQKIEEMLSLQNERKTNASYHALHARWCDERNLPRELSFLFSNEERERLLAQLGIRDEGARAPLL